MKKISIFLTAISIVIQTLAVDYESVKVNLQIIQSEFVLLTEQIKRLPQKTVSPVLIPSIPIKKGVPVLLTKLNTLFSSQKYSNLFQLRVLQQVGGADCGYHALKNGILILNAFLAGDMEKDRTLYLNQLTDKDLYAKWLEGWSSLIKTNRKSTDDQWLQGNEIERLIRSEIPKDSEHGAQFFSVIDNPDWLVKDQPGEASGLFEDIVKVIKSYRTDQNFSHVFILANSREYANEKGFLKGSWTHWIAVGVQKVKGTPQYIVLDSLNTNRMESDHVVGLVNTLSTADIDSLEIKTSPINNYLGSIGTMLSVITGDITTYKGTKDEAFQRALFYAQEIVRIAKEKKWATKQAFQQYKKTLKDIIVELQKELGLLYQSFTQGDKKLKALQDLLTDIDNLK